MVNPKSLYSLLTSDRHHKSILLPGVCARICVSGGRRSHIRRVASRYPDCGGSIEEVESSDHGQFMPLLFAVDLRYDLPRSRATFGTRAEEVKRKNIAKVPRRASSRVVGRGDIIQQRAGEPAGTKLDRIELSRSLAEVGDDKEGHSVLGGWTKLVRSSVSWATTVSVRR